MSVHCQQLRDAAEQMRSDHGPEHKRHAMWDAMADLLDGIAAEGWTDEDFGDGDYITAALEVANTYLAAAWSKS